MIPTLQDASMKFEIYAWNIILCIDFKIYSLYWEHHHRRLSFFSGVENDRLYDPLKQLWNSDLCFLELIECIESLSNLAGQVCRKMKSYKWRRPQCYKCLHFTQKDKYIFHVERRRQDETHSSSSFSRTLSTLSTCFLEMTLPSHMFIDLI